MIFSIQPDRLELTGRLPGDPFVAQTALACTAIAQGPSRLDNVPDDADTAVMLAALEALGARVERDESTVTITPPANGLAAPSEPISLGNASYPLRLLIGILAAQPFQARLVADAPLNKRNIERVLGPLREIGAELTSSDRGTPPVYTFPATLRGGEQVSLPIGNAFVKSALITAARAAGVALTITEPAPSRDHAERIFNAEIGTTDRLYTVRLSEGIVEPIVWGLPSDSTLADHLTALTILRPDSSIAISGRLRTPLETRALDAMISLGAAISFESETPALVSEPTARLLARSSRIDGSLELTGGDMMMEAAIPLLATLVGCGGGEITVRGAINLRQQSCDRIAALVDNLSAFGIETEEYDDGLRVRHTGAIEGGIEISAYDDPVIASAMIVLCAAGREASTLYDVPDDHRCRALARLLGGMVQIDDAANGTITDRHSTLDNR